MAPKTALSENIMSATRWVVEGQRKGDFAVFAFKEQLMFIVQSATNAVMFSNIVVDKNILEHVLKKDTSEQSNLRPP